MKQGLRAALAVMLFMVLTIGSFAMVVRAGTPTAASTPTATVTVTGVVTKTITLPQPTKTITVEEDDDEDNSGHGNARDRVPIPTVTIKIPLPGPTKTIRIPQPGPTKTVTAPAPPQKTVVIPGPTRTVTAQPNNTSGSQGGSSASGSIADEGAGRSAPVPRSDRTGQPSKVRVTVTPAPKVKTKTVTETRTKTETIVRNVFVGALVVFLLVLLAAFAGIGGYILGHNHAVAGETKFLKSLTSKK